MLFRRFRSTLLDQRGTALPLALIVLMVVTSLTLAFLAMSSSEPLIATNLKSGEQGLAFAEAGVERTLWALANPTVATAGANTQLNNLNAIPAAYSVGAGQALFTITPPGAASPTGAFAVTISGAGLTTINATGYVLRNGAAAPPSLLSQLAASDIAARRQIQLKVTASGSLGGSAAPSVVSTGGGLPGALTVGGSVQMSGSSLADGLHKAPGVSNGCSNAAGVTIRDKSNDGSLTNSISVNNNNRIVGTVPNQDPSLPPGAQTLAAANFNQYLFTDAQLAGLKALAQSQGTYVKPTDTSQFQLNVTPGLVFVDTVDGEPLRSPPDASQLAKVKLAGINTGGWIIVMGSITIDGNVSAGGVNYNGLIYAVNDITYKGTGTGGIFGGMVSANIIDSIATIVDTDVGGNANIYYDCAAIANGGGTFGGNFQSALNGATVSISPGTWREVSN
jgi:Tfp pilus assembly protein PilX